jgi:tetratricopeptide (TPR) repeat protein
MKASRIRARQWSRTAWTMAALFASLPLASRVFLGSWSFEGAAGIAFVCLLFGTYWHVVARRYRSLPDPATRLEEAMEAARAGELDRAIALLTREIRLSPELWQAYQYRGELYLLLPDCAPAALQDFETAMRLAPEEVHLRRLRDHAAGLSGA